ncbi:uncharacterized protein LOC116406126 isoform X1 [Cucumis sativus]|uniref:uncharacterized protein LOC116406126 isoform X1 n=1 Tax=Cucumis sativus TaxID=3659 RepID=UPI0012F4EBB1|nr:uncharacterized protein LOC116406126 isoform X1 [Cucumis sativus]XP_031745680.1 uncharacterized protein LOC116406126 isoform X1 [Cucumis sativus]
MEELRKLEQVHTLITLMDSRGIPITSSSSSNRFIANFLLLLVLSHSTSSLLYVLNSSSNLNISIPPLPLVKWCNHVESLTLTINSIWFLNTCRSFRKSFLAMYHCCLAMETIGERRWKTLCSLIVTISWILVLPRTIVGKWLWLAWMQCSVQILHLKILSYFMFHGMDANKPQSVFKYFPILSFTESYIYQLDTLNEKIVLGGFAFGESQETNEKSTKILSAIRSDPLQPLINLLKSHGLLTDRLVHELRSGEEYWALERDLCGALASNGRSLSRM